jgi:hypothetical protein
MTQASGGFTDICELANEQPSSALRLGQARWVEQTAALLSTGHERQRSGGGRTFEKVRVNFDDGARDVQPHGPICKCQRCVCTERLRQEALLIGFTQPRWVPKDRSAGRQNDQSQFRKVGGK